MVQDYILIRSDGYVVVMARDVGKCDGASIPWLFQALPRMGSPLEGLNPWWSCHHDGGYNGSAIVFDVRTVPATQWRMFADDWATFKGSEFEVTEWPKRKWWDVGMRAVMKEIGEPRIKRWLAYRAVRVGGWLPWRRAWG
jgi:hypothetical protein